MARRTTKNLTMPWEGRGTWLRELFFGRHVRMLPWLVLAGVATVVLITTAVRGARVRRTRIAIERVERALTAFRLDFGRCPTSMTELVHPPRVGVRYLESEPVDAWDQPLWVRCPGRMNEDDGDVVSAGPSRNFLVDDNVW